MNQYDLFGNKHPLPAKTFEEEYADYLRSARWKAIRQAKIKAVGACERCGRLKWVTRLEVHHKTYENFKQERPADLEVLCPACHATADQERKIQAQADKLAKKQGSSLARGFERWMDKGNVPNWRRLNDNRLRAYWKSFLEVISQHTGQVYEASFWRDPAWSFNAPPPDPRDDFRYE